MKGIGWKRVNWISLPHDMDKWWDFVSKIRNIWVP